LIYHVKQQKTDPSGQNSAKLQNFFSLSKGISQRALLFCWLPSYHREEELTMTLHGQLYLRDQTPAGAPLAARGRFGRLFPNLPPFAADTPAIRATLRELGQPGGRMDAQDDLSPGADLLRHNARNADHPKLPLGFTFLGQFLDHDVTFDPTSSLERQTDPSSTTNFRTPAFELDSLYGSGRAVNPHLYDQTTPGAIKFLIDAVAPRDLPRNSQNVAIIGDPRNDENLIISQLHLALLKFHNAVVDALYSPDRNPNEIFDQAQRLVRWHYQWIIVHEFLPRIVGWPLVLDTLRNGRKFYHWADEPFIPVEFSVAVFRFGHSLLPPAARVNFAGDHGKPLLKPLFDANLPDSPDPDDLRGGKRAPRRYVDWATMFDLGDGQAQPSKRMDTRLSTPLFSLPFIAPRLPENPAALPQRNLLRHLTFGLPSGQAIAAAMQLPQLSPRDLADLKLLAGFDQETPLWFYILREAEIMEKGQQLGPVGGRILAEVFIGLLQGDAKSYLNQDPSWQPNLGQRGVFTIVDLLRFAGLTSLTSY
jgi:hypothetical protein